MSLMHSHHHEHGHHQRRESNKRGLTIALVITASIMILEFFGGLLTNSLALLSDSGHMLSDSASLALSLFAMWFAAKPLTAKNTYGYYRVEILAALFNAVTLFAIAAFIIWEAVDRFREPPEVAGGTMMIIAFIGLAANFISAYSLMRVGDVKENVNVRSAYLHVIGDALGSAGALLAGFLMITFSWYIADPIISVIVSLLILKSAWGLLKRSIHILMEGTPHEVDHDELHDALKAIPGVIRLHDLHIWTITSGMDALSCHLDIIDEANEQEVLQTAINRIKRITGITHTTIQIEKSTIQHDPIHK
ncbi:cation diffusion facilitator family transporter [Mechercharimyces sp. CAU 1602]|nr:cation diffusion facilitator family transporter [Mechercharimyces sp. CAU 1602]